MKKIFLSLLVIVSMIVITGCNSKKEELENKKENNNVVKNSVVLYFSATGTTKAIAERIASKSGSDIIEIIPKVEYTSNDLNYNSDCRANKEQNDSASRPEIKNTIDISKYEVIYLGYPIWWGTNPKIILTLLDTYDFTNKIIVPFCTSGSTGIEKSVKDLQSYNSKLNIRDGKRFTLKDNDEEIIKFIDSL